MGEFIIAIGCACGIMALIVSIDASRRLNKIEKELYKNKK